ncbi:MAG: hypothetical protein MjAS7_0107 [Metallosphaera javensis (ex Sakai et al. 2022)]|nr:MAG: hypothetical protein MjAS7_0107 [Metallosphaera javensis (ex Sakai et al. 2022)]
MRAIQVKVSDSLGNCAQLQHFQGFSHKINIIPISTFFPKLKVFYPNEPTLTYLERYLRDVYI